MNILIFCGYLSKRLNANNKIASIIADEMSKLGHNVTLAGITTNESACETEIAVSENGRYTTACIVPNSVYYRERHRLGNAICGKKGLARTCATLCYAVCHPASFAKAVYSYSPLFSPASECDEAVVFTEKYCREHNIDVVMGVMFPAMSLDVIFGGKLAGVKRIVYQLDPYALHENNSPEEQQHTLDHESACFAKADCVFSTDLLLDKYKNHSRYAAFADKIHVAQFPTLSKPNVITPPPFEMPKDKTNIVFCGTIDDDYRSPQKFLSCMEQIWQNDRSTAVHFVGINKSDVCKKYAQLYPENVFVHPRIETDYVAALLDSADILLNIGNRFTMQVPSKIFEYFSTGKPIIHQQIIGSCTCTQYMEKYPLAFCFNDSCTDTAQQLHSFIAENRSRRLDWQQVEAIFADNLPPNVAQKMLDVITNL